MTGILAAVRLHIIVGVRLLLLPVRPPQTQAVSECNIFMGWMPHPSLILRVLPTGRHAPASRHSFHDLSVACCKPTSQASYMTQPLARRHHAPASRQRAKQRSSSPSNPRMVPPRDHAGAPPVQMSSRRSAPAPLQSPGRRDAERKARLHLIPEQGVPLAPHKPQRPWHGRKPGKPLCPTSARFRV